jgi:hypothetical protein
MRSVRQQGLARRLKTVASAVESLKKGRAPTWRSNDLRAVGSSRQPYIITRGWKEYYFTTGTQASLPAFLG